ncbi:AraC family transcriptional regulator [Streptomyces sp. NBC_00893]|uniref:AraC family transcriptional regulator n=1 Tax=Streptomyces sp. NBC_00893 TaxID=2975862 RepID=UPI00225056CB|nr:AraC family transcriptional regulator [Streptomyces sp. NBC_00893]MCX4850331.1 AraC family transcriptional regulator [Streptomyces sp. NBC_00893]
MVTSHIKPHLTCLTSSAENLGHAVAERAIERAAGHSDTTPPPIGPSSHVLVVHTGRSTNLRWSDDGTARQARFLAGEALINPAGYASRPRWQENVELMLLALEPMWLEKLAAESGMPGSLELTPSYHFADPLLTMLVQRIVAAYEGPEPVDSLYAESLVQAVAAIVIRHNTQAKHLPARDAGMPARRIAELRDYIHVNLSRRLTLDELAKVAGVSTSHFNRIFKAATGETPYQYVLRQRVERARDALLHTDTSIADIALSTGFADQSHLTRSLRRAFGLTPRTLRADRATQTGYADPP